MISGGLLRRRSRSRGARASRSSSTRDRDGSEDAVSERSPSSPTRAAGLRWSFTASPPARSWAERAASGAGTACSRATSPIRRPDAIREAALVPGSLLVETDSPFLATARCAASGTARERGGHGGGGAPRSVAFRTVISRNSWRRTPRVFEVVTGSHAVTLAAPARPELPRGTTCSRRSCRRPGSTPPTSSSRWGRRRRAHGRLAPAVACLHVIEVDGRLRVPARAPRASRRQREPPSGGMRCGSSWRIWPRLPQDGGQPALLDGHPAADPDDPWLPSIGAGW